MKKIILTISIFSVGLFFLSCIQGRSIATKIPMSKDVLLKEAKLLNHAGSQYLDARLQNQWKAIYEFQHPEFQKTISFEEFQYFNGSVVINYREDKNFHISGAPTPPPVEEIKKNPFRTNPFTDLPVSPTYRLIPNILTDITSHKLEGVFIDDSGTIGKVAISLKVETSMPPIFRAPDLKMKEDIMYIDYWEKVNGKWFLAIMKWFPEFHISGVVPKKHPVPVDMSRWDTANFTNFNPEELNSR